jgi:hypothetical protein
MTEIIFYREGNGFVVERLSLPSSTIVGRGRTKAEALGSLMLAAMSAEGDERIVSELSIAGEYASYEEYMQYRLERIGRDDLVP